MFKDYLTCVHGDLGRILVLEYKRGPFHIKYVYTDGLVWFCRSKLTARILRRICSPALQYNRLDFLVERHAVNLELVILIVVIMVVSKIICLLQDSSCSPLR